jgi:hypothetical protein
MQEASDLEQRLRAEVLQHQTNVISSLQGIHNEMRMLDGRVSACERVRPSSFMVTCCGGFYKILVLMLVFWGVMMVIYMFNQK